MSNYKREWWGQEIEQVATYPDTWQTHIKEGIFRKGQPPKVGINRHIVKFLANRKATLIISCDNPKVEFPVFMGKDILKRGEKHKKPSNFEGCEPMLFYLFRTPRNRGA